jgi:hypothetical protein
VTFRVQYYEGMQMERLEGMTITAGSVVGQAQLIGLIRRVRELGLELVSVERARPEETDSGLNAAATPDRAPAIQVMQLLLKGTDDIR